MTLPDLSSEWLGTRDSLQSHSQVVGAIRRELTPPQGALGDL